MAEKIAKFKQALRAKGNQKNQSTDLSAFEKEMQKYKLSEKEETKKRTTPNQETKTDQVSTKAPDTRSKISKPFKSATNVIEKKAPLKTDGTAIKKESVTNADALRLSAHARSSQLIQRKDTSDSKDKINKPDKRAAQGTEDSIEDGKVNTTSKADKETEKPLNFFKNIITSIHKHILAGDRRPSNVLTQKLISSAEIGDNAMSRIMHTSMSEANSIEIIARLSDEVSQLANSAGTQCESETSVWRFQKESKPKAPSLFHIPSADLTPKWQPAKGHKSHIHNSSPVINSYSIPNSPPSWYTNESIFTDQPFSQKRPFEFNDRDESPPRRKLAKTLNSSPLEFEPHSLDLDDEPLVAGDFFGFSQSQEKYSDSPCKKLFCSRFI